MKIEQLGRHILVEFYNCDKEILNDHGLIEEYMNQAAEKAKATIVKSVFHLFNPWGVSGVVVIQESHLTIHTWPEYGYAAVDLFTCGEEVDPWIAFEHLKNKLGADRTETLEVPRGMVDKIKRFSSEENLEIDNFKAKAI
ncbi:S-adenosylmethionine decarboxylase proenzyme SpeH [Gottschalkia purinilytica]|uniref:S-adenosylmethionine decarboxylase proenzyme n=1 Tax=Gottschalkia purinilytica TaxID=1503 RepID=A0A0L0WED9_GOTPU|nr:adenosylmethionine decarboxylase [Gottschalkia purinilytica]KNF09790.1 S-adenosylmethionine decarboxylase proenzyme SpeH [Gottschalkia purinilytica]